MVYQAKFNTGFFFFISRPPKSALFTQPLLYWLKNSFFEYVLSKTKSMTKLHKAKIIWQWCMVSYVIYNSDKFEFSMDSEVPAWSQFLTNTESCQAVSRVWRHISHRLWVVTFLSYMTQTPGVVKTFDRGNAFRMCIQQVFSITISSWY